MSFVMADFYKRFVDEELDSEGRLKSFKLDLPENFNFSYDVIDELGCWHTELRRAILLWLFLNVIMSSGSLLTVL